MNPHKEFPVLYKKSGKKIQEWIIQVFLNNDGTAFTRVTHGQTDGAKQTTEVKYAKGKNIGRSNETSAVEQACSEANSKWLKQQDKGYSQNPDGKSDLVAPFVMRAHEYKDYKNSVTFPAKIQPKFDGCVSEDTILQTLEYGEIKIGKIVNEKLSCHVKSYNSEKNVVEYKKVSSFFKNRTLNENIQWFELELENGKKITVTGNHRVYIPDMKCWRRVDELDGNENLMVN